MLKNVLNKRKPISYLYFYVLEMFNNKFYAHTFSGGGDEKILSFPIVIQTVVETFVFMTFDQSLIKRHQARKHLNMRLFLATVRFLPDDVKNVNNLSFESFSIYQAL